MVYCIIFIHQKIEKLEKYVIFLETEKKRGFRGIDDVDKEINDTRSSLKELKRKWVSYFWTGSVNESVNFIQIGLQDQLAFSDPAQLTTSLEVDPYIFFVTKVKYFTLHHSSRLF